VQVRAIDMVCPTVEECFCVLMLHQVPYPKFPMVHHQKCILFISVYKKMQSHNRNLNVKIHVDSYTRIHGTKNI
jgi:hypothetical protein